MTDYKDLSLLFIEHKISITYSLADKEKTLKDRKHIYKKGRALFLNIIKLVRKIGFTVSPDLQAYNGEYPAHTRKAINAYGLELELDLNICNEERIEITFYENVNDHTHENIHGGKYISAAISKMPYLTRLSVYKLLNNIINYLNTHYELTEIIDKYTKPKEHPHVSVTRAITECWHYVPELGRANISCAHNAISADKIKLSDGMEVWVVDWKTKRWIKGTIRYRLNQQWYFITSSTYQLVMAHECYVHKPANIHKRDIPIHVVRKHMHSKAKQLNYAAAHSIQNHAIDKYGLVQCKEADIVK